MATAAAGQGRRASGIIGEQLVEIGGEGWVILRVEERSFELLQCRHEDLGHKAAAEPAEAAGQAHARSRSRPRGRSVSNSAAIFSGDLLPGWRSTAEPTSIA